MAKDKDIEYPHMTVEPHYDYYVAVLWFNERTGEIIAREETPYKAWVDGQVWLEKHPSAVHVPNN